MKTFFTWVVVGTLMSGCAATEGLRQTSGPQLYEAVSSGGSSAVAVIDARTHATDRHLPLGVPSPDWRHVYAIDGKTLIEINPASGVATRTLDLGAEYQLPPATAAGIPGGLSPDGARLVVERFDRSAGGTPMETHMLVVDTRTLRVSHAVDLRGYLQFDAINDSGTSVYLIEHVVGGEYYVRLYDVQSGTLEPDIVADKRDGNEAMAGLRLSGVASPNGEWLFSVYVRDHAGPFIHALNLNAPYALCIDLPGAGYLDDPSQLRWSLAMDPANGLLYAVNTATGTVLEVASVGGGAPDITQLKHFAVPVVKTGQLKGNNAAVVAGKMLIAGGPSGIAWFETTDLAMQARALAGWNVASVGLSRDGKTLYAVDAAGRIAVIDVGTDKVASTFDPLAGRPMALMRVAST